MREVELTKEILEPYLNLGQIAIGVHNHNEGGRLFYGSLVDLGEESIQLELDYTTNTTRTFRFSEIIQVLNPRGFLVYTDWDGVTDWVLEHIIEPFQEERRVEEKIVYKPKRKRLPTERPSLTHKFSIAGHEGYLHIGLFPETEMPGEIFITMAKQGSTIAGLMDAFATSISIALQYGVPLEDLCNKFSHMRFEPSGFTNNKRIPIAKSIMDYIFRYLSLKFLSTEIPDSSSGDLAGGSSSPVCPECGSTDILRGSMHTCNDCGTDFLPQ